MILATQADMDRRNFRQRMNAARAWSAWRTPADPWPGDVSYPGSLRVVFDGEYWVVQ